MTHDVHIIGGGLAGCEAAWQLAQRGFRVRISEMRGSGEMTPAHQTNGLAELVCSNSFRSDDDTKNAVGLLHHEMRQFDSIIMQAGEIARVPAGSAMAVDRDVFSRRVEQLLTEHPNVEVVRERVDVLPESGMTIVSTGPLTASVLGCINDGASLIKHVFKIDTFAAIQFSNALGIPKNFSSFTCQILAEGFLHHPRPIPIKEPRDFIEFGNEVRWQAHGNLRFFFVQHGPELRISLNYSVTQLRRICYCPYRPQQDRINRFGSAV